LSEVVEGFFRVLAGFARWYLRRGFLTRVFLFLVFVVLPLSLYYYGQFSELYRQAGTADQFPAPAGGAGFPVVPCYRYLEGRELYVVGSLDVAGDCYSIGRRMAVFPAEGGVAMLVVEGDPRHAVAVVISLPVNETLVVPPEELRVVRKILVVYVESAGDYEPVVEAVRKHGLRGELCRFAQPSAGWGDSSVPSELYSRICRR